MAFSLLASSVSPTSSYQSCDEDRLLIARFEGQARRPRTNQADVSDGREGRIWTRRSCLAAGAKLYQRERLGEERHCVRRSATHDPL